MIHVENLRINYGDVPALNRVSLEVQPGEWVLITGPSGCGKSTLAKALCGIIPHADPVLMDGSVVIDGLDTRATPLPELTQHVGIVFQNPGSQLFHLRVEDEIAFGPRNLGLNEDEVKARVEWAMQATGIMALRDRKPAELSGGQKQIVAITAVLAMRPRVLILDEPTASLDVPNIDRVITTLLELRNKHNITIIMVEHRLASALNHADRVVLMEAGEIVFDGRPQDVFNDRERRDALGLRRAPRHRFPHWEELAGEPSAANLSRDPLLRLEEVWAGYNGTDVLQGINLALHPGDFLALVGSNGSGKSTLAMVAAGLLKPGRGKVKFAGRKRPRPGRDVALLFQDAANQLFTDSVDEEVAFGPRNYGCFQAEAHQRVMTQADLLALAERRPFQLSVGQQQRTALGACLAICPEIVILDEPTLGQDWGHLQQLMDFLNVLNAGGTAVLLISHDYKLVHRYARRVAQLENGRITDIREGEYNA
ncbi:MAG: energy-coupling factor ABC transporter ATP-binding protein [Anaerolineae bacterium]|nr:energy-coupling factor ABC transporter ATP-binding protein [Anaerolineae bacterium]